MVKKLNENQKKLIEENMNLIYGFMKEHSIPYDNEDVYDYCLTGLINAAMTYDKGKCQFSTYAYVCMKSELLHYYSYISRKRHIPEEMICRIDEPVMINGQETVFTYHDLILSKDIDPDKKISSNTGYTLIMDSLSEREAMIVNYLIEGYTYREVADALHCSHQRINQIVDRIRKKIVTMYSNQKLALMR